VVESSNRSPQPAATAEAANIQPHVRNTNSEATRRLLLFYDKGGEAEKMVEELEKQMMENKAASEKGDPEGDPVLTLLVGNDPRLEVSVRKTGHRIMAWLSLLKQKKSYPVTLDEMKHFFDRLRRPGNTPFFVRGAADKTGFLDHVLQTYHIRDPHNPDDETECDCDTWECGRWMIGQMVS